MNYYGNNQDKEEDSDLTADFYIKKRETLDNYTKFPWHWFGWDYPMWGSVHSYLCQYLKDYIDVEELRTFICAKPSLFEVKRAAQIYDSRYLTDIATYCDKIYQQEDFFDKIIIAKAVHHYISRDIAFTKDFNILFTAKWKRGEI